MTNYTPKSDDVRPITQETIRQETIRQTYHVNGKRIERDVPVIHGTLDMSTGKLIVH